MKLFCVHQVLTRSESPPSLTQKAFLNILAAFLDYGARVIISLFVTPILVSGLGSTLFGIWQILNRLVGFISAADGRPTQALKWVIANNQAAADLITKRKAVGSALGVWLVLLPFSIAAGLIIIWLSPEIARVPSELTTVVRMTCALLVINLILTVLAGVPDSVLRGMNLGYKRMGVMASLNILGGLLTVGAIYLKWGLVGVALAQVTVTVITGILFCHLVKTYVPWFGVARASWAEIRHFFRLSIWYSACDLVNVLLIASDVVVLGWLLSASVVSSYVLTGYGANMVAGIIMMIVGASMPGLGGLVGDKKYARVIEIRNEITLLTCLLATVAGGLILLWNRSFVTLWVGGKYYAGPWVNLLLVMIAVQLLFIRNDASVINLTLNVREKALVGLIAALLSIGLAFPLTTTLGMIGLCMAVLVGRMLMLFTYPAIIGSFFGIPIHTQVGVILRPLVVMGILFTASVYVGQELLVVDWLTLLLYVCLSMPILFLFQFFMGIPRHYRVALVRRLRYLLVRN